MARIEVTAQDQARVSAAVAAAEAQTSGEIVTIIARCSDPYRDVALHYAVLAMLAVPVKLALLPQAWLDRVSALLLGWNPEWTRGGAMLALLALLALAFLVGRAVFSWRPLLLALTPGATKSRRVRRRAIAHFRSACEARTRGRTGILIYLSLDERRAEIVADAAIHAKVAPEAWGEAMAALVGQVRAGRVGDGMALAVAQVGALLAQHLPRAADDDNELPDRLILI
jgi:putative membrane protein